MARKGSTKATGRSYTYDTKYEAQPEQVANRVKRNQARAKVEQARGSIPQGLDVGHKQSLKDKGSNSLANLRLETKKTNRGRKT